MELGNRHDGITSPVGGRLRTLPDSVAFAGERRSALIRAFSWLLALAFLRNAPRFVIVKNLDDRQRKAIWEIRAHPSQGLSASLTSEEAT